MLFVAKCEIHCVYKIYVISTVILKHFQFSHIHSHLSTTREIQKERPSVALALLAQGVGGGGVVDVRGRSGARSCQESEVGGAARQAKVAAAAGASASRTYRHRQILALVFLTSHSPTPPANT